MHPASRLPSDISLLCGRRSRSNPPQKGRSAGEICLFGCLTLICNRSFQTRGTRQVQFARTKIVNADANALNCGAVTWAGLWIKSESGYKTLVPRAC
jgi:hypothetical protein